MERFQLRTSRTGTDHTFAVFNEGRKISRKYRYTKSIDISKYHMYRIIESIDNFDISIFRYLDISIRAMYRCIGSIDTLKIPKNHTPVGGDLCRTLISLIGVYYGKNAFQQREMLICNTRVW